MLPSRRGWVQLGVTAKHSAGCSADSIVVSTTYRPRGTSSTISTRSRMCGNAASDTMQYKEGDLRIRDRYHRGTHPSLLGAVTSDENWTMLRKRKISRSSPLALSNGLDLQPLLRPLGSGAVLFPRALLVAQHSSHIQQSYNTGIRWMTTTKNQNSSESNTNDSSAPHRAFEGEHADGQQQQQQSSSSSSSPQPTTTTPATSLEESTRERITAGAAAATHQLEQRIKMVVNELNLGDQMAVLLIVIFTSILLISPYAMRHMKRAATAEDDYEDRLQTDDFVDEFAKLARTEWGTEILPDGADKDSKNVVEVLLKDVFQSTALQHAAQEFVVQILQSERFREAVRHLVKELWSDLVSDPETIAQVVKLLEIAIRNPDIQLAAQDLVLKVFVQEPDVREALIGVIQQLAVDDRVRQAVERLLTDSAHTTLSDPDILEHSMEFATDVVGDDIVQQTAGEALRKSVGHAVRPTTTVLVAAVGVGFLIFGVVAIGYSRSSEQEAVLFESAARLLQSNATLGMMRILTWPLRALHMVAEKAVTGLWMMLPERTALVRCRDRTAQRLALALDAAVRYVATQSVALPWRALKATGRWLSSVTWTLLQKVGDRLLITQGEVSNTVSTLCSVVWTGNVRWLQHFVMVSRNSWEALCIDALCWSQRAIEASRKGWYFAEECTVLGSTRLVEALLCLWNRVTRRSNDLDLS